jgi:hypothetical protein
MNAVIPENDHCTGIHVSFHTEPEPQPASSPQPVLKSADLSAQALVGFSSII